MNSHPSKQRINVWISPERAITIDAVGYAGSSCEEATAFLELALGTVGRRQRNRDYYRSPEEARAEVVVKSAADELDRPLLAWSLTTDWWNGHVEKEVGPNYGRLLQLYGVHKTTREARRKRLRVTRHTETDGSIRLSLAA
jgi:hypothetical protein